MRHARPDYNRIQDPAVHDPSLLGVGSTAIGDDEPVFIIRAKDRTAPRAVEAWADIAASFGAPPDIVNLARGWAAEMRVWQDAHSAKLPDLPRK